MNLNLLQEFIQRQRDGIREARVVAYMPRGLVPTGDAMLDELGVSDAKRVALHLAELEFVEPTPAPRNNPVRIFSATRLTWKQPIEPGCSPLDYKGSDIMIRGLGLFHRQTGVRMDIQLIRKGRHVVETEKLIDEEGLTDQVTWLQEMSQAEVWSQFARCDIVVEQLADSVVGMAGSDAMATGRPVIGNARPEIVDQGLHVCQARTAEEVLLQLNRLVFDPDERDRMGAIGREFIEKNYNRQRAAQICLERLKAALASYEAPAKLSSTADRYYLQRRHNERQAFQSLQQTLQATKTEIQASQQTLQATQAELQATQARLQATQTKLSRYENSLPARVVRKLAGLVRKVS
jgi:glycosyltransferase involved in cell wall biosynthesis